MYPMAQILHAKGYYISGSDNNETDTLQRVRDMGIKVYLGQRAENIEGADLIVYAPGVGKAKSKVFQQRQEQVLTALTPYEAKLHCICNEDGKARLQHPLSPAVRIWNLSQLSINELLPKEQVTEPAIESKKKGRHKAIKNEIPSE